jgi:hypothetical protein
MYALRGGGITMKDSAAFSGSKLCLFQLKNWLMTLLPYIMPLGILAIHSACPSCGVSCAIWIDLLLNDFIFRPFWWACEMRQKNNPFDNGGDRTPSKAESETLTERGVVRGGENNGL